MQDVKQSIKFSILTPVYNVEKYLDDCINSVLAQSYSNYELILVDDGSTDGSGVICDRYAAEYPQIKVFHKPNGGLLHTRRFALTKASGDYLVHLDSDDALSPNALETIYNTVQKYNCDCVVYGYARVSEGKVLSVVTDPEVFYSDDKRVIYKKCFSKVEYNSLCRKSYRRSLLTGEDFSKYYHIQLSEDLLQSMEILKSCGSIVFLPDVLYRYTFNPASMTLTKRYENYRVDYTVRKRVLEFLGEEDAFTEEDYNEYRGSCVQWLIQQIIPIAGFETTIENKIALFEQLAEDQYYTQFLLGGSFNRKALGAKAVFFDLFRRKQYRLIIFLVCLIRKLCLSR